MARFRISLLLAGALASTACGCGRGWSGKPGRSLILITVDTLRADHLGCYGARTPATPRIDSLAGEGSMFGDVTAVMPMTLPAHASIMTGRYPMAHGARHNGSYVLPEEETTLAEALRAKGFRTAAFVGSFPVTARFGLGQGFETFDEAFTGAGNLGEAALGGGVERTGVEVNQAMLPWLRKTAASGEAFFLWVHYFDPHSPYEPPEHLAKLYEKDPYSGEVAAVDEAVGSLLDTLQSSGAAGRTAVVLIADHGEALGDHGEQTHGYFVYQPTLRVPLIARVPWVAAHARRLTQVVSQVDVMPTVLDLLGVGGPAGMQGRSLAPLLEGRELPDRPVLGDCPAPWLEFRFSPLRLVRDGRWKYVESARPELYDLSTDPDEARNLVGEKASEAARLRSLLGVEYAKAADAAAAGRSARGVGEEEREKLASLGYVAGGSALSADPVPAPSDKLRDPRDGLPFVSRFEDAYYDFRHGDYAKAAAAFQALEKDVPESPTVKYQLSQALLMSGDAAGARVLLQKLVQAEPRYAAARVRLGQALEVLDEKEKALEQYRSAATLSNALPEARVLLGMLLFRTGKPDEGVEEVRRAIHVAPDNIPYRRNLVALLEQTGRPKEAEEVMADFTRSRPEDPRAWNELGNVQLHHREFDGAEKSFREAARLDPANATARTNLGSLLLLKKDYAAAEREYRAAVKADPDLPDARLSLARAILFQKREQEGKTILGECASRWPSDSRTRSYWGLYLYEIKGDPVGAKEAFREALELNPRDPIAREGLSEGPGPGGAGRRSGTAGAAEAQP